MGRMPVSYLDHLKTEAGRAELETLKSVQAEPRRWLQLSEVAERNRYGHAVTDPLTVAHCLTHLYQRGLINQMFAHRRDPAGLTALVMIYGPNRDGQQLLEVLGEAE